MRKKKKTQRVRSNTSTKKKRVYKKKKVVKSPKVARTRNNGTLTESEYFSKIRSALRNAFKFWKPMTAALAAASRPSQSDNKRLKTEYQCAHCKKWFPRKEVEIDHIEACGSLSSLEDIPSFIKRLTIEDITGFQILCKPDHKKKTDADNLARKISRGIDKGK